MLTFHRFEATNFARSMKINYFEISACKNIAIEDAFVDLMRGDPSSICNVMLLGGKYRHVHTQNLRTRFLTQHIRTALLFRAMQYVPWYLIVQQTTHNSSS